MSISFFPADNQKYCDANGLTGEEVYECQCVDFNCTKGCKECNETGKVSFKAYPFERSLCNSNGKAILRLFGIDRSDDCYCGSADAQKFLDGVEFARSLRTMGHEPLVREHQLEQRHRIFGRTAEQVESYLDSFEEMAKEALRRKFPIVWG